MMELLIFCSISFVTVIHAVQICRALKYVNASYAADETPCPQ